jgi:hypothetical protein
VPSTETHAHAYCTWLLETGRSVSTATQYASALESFLKNVDPHDSQQVADYFVSRSIAWRGKVTLAYRAFVKFRAEEDDLDWPPLNEQIPSMPEDVLLAVAPLIDQSGVRVVTQLTWADVDRVRSRIYAPGVKHQVLAQGSRVGEWIASLDSWGAPASEDAPLVPLSAGSLRPRPERILSKDRKQAEVLIRERADHIRPLEGASEDVTDAAAPSEGESLPTDAEGRLEALRGVLGREPTEQEKAIYQI